MTKKFVLPEQSVPTEDLIDRFSILTIELLIEEVFKYKKLRETNGITVKDVCLRSRMHPTFCYKIEAIDMLPTV